MLSFPEDFETLQHTIYHGLRNTQRKKTRRERELPAGDRGFRTFLLSTPHALRSCGHEREDCGRGMDWYARECSMGVWAFCGMEFEYFQFSISVMDCQVKI